MGIWRFNDFVKDAIKNTPEDALVGIGMANLSSTSQSMTISATRARRNIPADEYHGPSNAEERMNTAFDKAFGQEVQVWIDTVSGAVYTLATARSRAVAKMPLLDF
jgi:hypothetical protein